MAAFAGTAIAGSAARLAAVEAPAFLSGEAGATTRAVAWIGPVALLGGGATAQTGAGLAIALGHALAGAAVAASDAGLAIALGHALGGAAVAASGAALAQIGEPVELAGGATAATAAALVRLTTTAAIGGAAVAATAAGAWFAFAMPRVPEPGPGQQPGTVNLVRNPSLEYAGLTDWAAEGGGLALATDPDDPWAAWDGAFWAELAVADGEAAELAVVSQAGLAAAGGAWIGSLSLAGAGAGTALLRAEYADGTSEEGEPMAWAAEAAWRRAYTQPLFADPAKTLDRLALVVAVAAGAGERALRADGAQIEPDPGRRATPYAAGDQGPGHRWLGPAGLSASVREPR